MDHRALAGIALMLFVGCASPATAPAGTANAGLPTSAPPPSSRPADADAELEARVRAIVVTEKARLRACYGARAA